MALILIPQAIAYAAIAGLPPESGLFAATLPLIFAAPFVSCPWLQTGPVALTSLFAAGAIAVIANEHPDNLVGAASILAIIVGATRLTLGIFRLGGFTRIFTQPVVLGFTTAAAVLIISSQLPKTLGASIDDPNVIQRAIKSVVQLNWSHEAMFVALAAGMIAFYFRKIHRLFPSILLAVILAILFSRLVSYSGETVGELPGRFVSFKLDLPWHLFGSLLLPGVVIAFVGFAEPAAISIALMNEENREWDASQELRGGGLANIASGLIGGYPVGGSFSRTSINKFAGATTAWSGLMTGTIVVSFLWLTPYLSPLPTAALGAIIILAVVRLIKLREILQLLKSDPISGLVAIATMLATLLTAPEIHQGILIGAAIGLLASLYQRKYSPSNPQN